MGVNETCSVCQSPFELQFRFQMEERDGGFLFFCSQGCLAKSQQIGASGLVVCDACAKSFRVELVSNVFYVKGQRKYACSMECRTQLAREADGVRLGEIAARVCEEEGTEAPAPLVAEASAAPVARPIDAAIKLPSLGSSAAAASAEPSRAPARPIVPASAARGAADAPRVIAVFNHKGGTGKTTTSVSVAAGLAMRGKKVLLVDTDAQGNVAVSLDVKAQRSLYHVLVMGLSVSDAVCHVRDNLDLLPSNESLAAAELYLAGRTNRDRVLAKRLEKTVEAYDHVVLDCSPSLSLMNQNALVFADGVLVPVACDYLSLVGVRQVIRTVKNVNQLLHHPVRIWGVLPTFYDARAKICREALDTLRGHFGDRCLSPIRAAMKVKEAPAQGKTIFEYAPGTNAVEDYENLVDRLLGADAGAAAEAQAG